MKKNPYFTVQRVTTPFKFIYIYFFLRVDIGIEFAENCIRHYELGHLKRIDRLRNLIGPRSVLVGSSYDGVSIHDCIKSADTQVKALLKRPAFKDYI